MHLKIMVPKEGVHHAQISLDGQDLATTGCLLGVAVDPLQPGDPRPKLTLHLSPDILEIEWAAELVEVLLAKDLTDTQRHT